MKAESSSFSMTLCCLFPQSPLCTFPRGKCYKHFLVFTFRNYKYVFLKMFLFEKKLKLAKNVTRMIEILSRFNAIDILAKFLYHLFSMSTSLSVCLPIYLSICPSIHQLILFLSEPIDSKQLTPWPFTFCLSLMGFCNRIPQTGRLINNRNLFLTVLELKSPKSSGLLIQRLVRACFLVHR